MNHQALSSFIWSVADLLRGDYKQSEYGKVILPFTVLRRLDCVLEATKPAVLAEFDAKTKAGLNPDLFLIRKAGQSFYNTSPLDLVKLLGDQDHIRQNLYAYVQAFSPAARDIFERFDFYTQVERLAKGNLLYLVTEKFANIDLHPEVVDNASMGLVFEELIRKFAEISNETAGEHFTPREVIRLMVNLLFIEDDDVLTPGNAVVRTIYDPTAGTGGMLSIAGEYLLEHNPQARLTMFGQELNDESYAICKADMLIKDQPVENIVAGNTLSDDGHGGRKFDYMLSNPPFGVEWKKVEKAVRQEHEQKGFDGRFGPGLPRVSDGSMLFLMHLLSKIRPTQEGGSRFGIVLNGSPLFTGGAGSGESEIRRYVLENDLVEAIVGLPTDMFYNTGISTYVWILSNRKPDDRKGYVQLIDASSFWQKIRKSLGSKRKEMSDAHIATVTRLFGDFTEAEQVTVFDAAGQQLGEPQLVTGTDKQPVAPEGGKLKRVPIARIFRNEEFGYTTITVERPLRDQAGNEEGFILDVLKNYTTYKLAFKLAHDGQEYDETQVERSAAMKGIMQWVRLHPYNISQKVQVVVEHYRENVQPLLDGRAKAMVVVGSRKEAVRWQKAIREYISKQNYPLGVLTAFSGEVNDPDSYPAPVTETSKDLNPGLKGRDIRDAFAEPEYHLLLVANKFQTGFDQPLLCGMYVDKMLGGIQAVQTLSRLNRAHPGKDTTYILDFVNDAGEILKAFKTYYETAELEATTDPHLVYDLRAKLDATGNYDQFEVDRVAKVELDPQGTQSQLSAALAPVADRLLKRYKAAQQDKAAAEAQADDKATQAAKDMLDALVLFKNDMGAYVRLYAFLSQIFDYGNTDIEKRFLFYKRLIPLLEFGRERDTVDLSKVMLTHHTLKKTGKQVLNLNSDGSYKLSPMDAVGSGSVQEKQQAYLDEIIQKVNGLFEGELTDDDQLVYVNGVIKGKLLENETLMKQAASNSKEQFANSPDLKDALMHAIMDALDAHTMMSTQALGSERVRDGLKDILLGPAQLYEALRARSGPRARL